MVAYRKERIQNAILFFTKEHHKKTKLYLSQTALYKYLAFFEFRSLKVKGKMPLELTYKAMEHGPVPVEIYHNKNESEFSSLVLWEEVSFKNGATGFIIKPNGKFNGDYFSANELKEMNALIEMFAQSWVSASVMSDASHQAIKAWKKTYKENPNGTIDPVDEFDRAFFNLPSDDLTAAEERYLINRKMSEIITC